MHYANTFAPSRHGYPTLLSTLIFLALTIVPPAGYAEETTASEPAEETTKELIQHSLLLASNRPLESLYVYGDIGPSKTATKLDLSVFETPQSVTVISNALIKDFALDNINDVLMFAPGVSVESVETDRTYYTARGFDIVNFQYDGVGLPFFYGVTQGQQDTAIYERVEIVKGAAGLITGLANPSATINYIRKRPTDDLQASISLTAGEWNKARVDADVSGSISSNIRGRVVAVKDESDSYLDRYSDDSSVIYSIFDIELAEGSLLTLGHSYNKSEANGNLWGALPLYYTDGTQTDYPVSTSTSADWNYWDVERSQTFVEFSQQLGDSWEIKALYNDNEKEQDSELLYVYGTPDRETEVGLFGWASAYDNREEQSIADVYLSGSFSLGGREHKLVVGISDATLDTWAQSSYDYTNGFPVLDGNWALSLTPRPSLTTSDPTSDKSKVRQEISSAYFAARFSPTDDFSLLLGARNVDIDQHGYNYGAPSNTQADDTVPYAGITYNITDTVMAYASFSEVFVQQTWVDANRRPLGATEGDNTEAGLKYEFNDGQATATLAMFKSTHNNLGEFVRRHPTAGFAIYDGRDYESQGYELEVFGEVSDGLNMSFGYMDVDVEDEKGETTRTHIPTKQIKLATAYQFQNLPDLKIGGSIKWQDEIFTDPIPNVRVTQEDYTLIDLFVRYQLNSNFSVALNAYNVTDEKYLNSLYWNQAFYGKPKHAQASLTWNY